MKTFLITSEKSLKQHAGEEWDDYVVVPCFLTHDNVDEWAKRLRNRVRKLWVEDEEPRGVSVTVDGNPVYNVIVDHLQEVMGSEEGISVVIPRSD